MDEFGKDDRGVGGRTRIEQEMQALREKMQAMRNSLPGGDFEALLTHQVREEFQRRWKLLDLPKNGQAALFSPLIETAGREWARMFKVWRNNNGIALSEVQAGTLAEMWINGLSAGQRDLLQWVMPVKETDAAWKARFEQFTLAHQNRMNDIRAAMGKSMDAAATRDDPSLLDMAVTKAGRLLGILEASDAWQAAQDDN